MFRTCQADDSLGRQFESLLLQQPCPEIGLLVGKNAAGSSKASLYGTIKTPCQEGLDPILVSGTGAGAGPAAGGSSKAGKKAGSGTRTGPGASPAGVTVILDLDWISEHARQVARMLPGGLSVLGLYVFCPDAAYTAAVPQLCTLMASLAAFCVPKPAAAAAAASGAPAGDSHLLLLHIDASSRKQVLRAVPVAPFPLPGATVNTATAATASSASLRPVELKFGPTLGSLVLLRCWHGVDLTLPIPSSAGTSKGASSVGVVPGTEAGGGRGAGAGAQMRRQLAALVAAESERVRCGVFMTARGAVPLDSLLVSDALGGMESSGSGSGSSIVGGGPLHTPTFDLIFLAPPRCQQLSLDVSSPQPRREEQQQLSTGTGGAPGTGSQAVIGQARLRGCIQGLAFVSKWDHVGRAFADLKADLLFSLSARLELLVEEAVRVSEQQQQEKEEGQQDRGGAQEPSPVVHPLLSSPEQLARSGGCDVAMPRRVVLPWLGGSLALCDYLLEGELPDAAMERAGELLALQGCQVLEYEKTAAPMPAGYWRPSAVKGQELPQGKKTATGITTNAAAPSGLACSGTMLASLAVAAVASAVGIISLLGPAGAQQ
ncbi:hypothetical protein Vretimale_5347 [Volvox reticuliferus]|uniref:Uncharacterized protein n=1 Tax=Volvox reticuliferus TaxID=1737510 RepID=A0A8J4DCG3_9CHLO|nr:hypothetical protein Vretifemale_3899 [Volvox reticuliferus]GIM00178.1 hypothetical protein Vretimale_5347 [Volvox reticuliferus]